MKLSKNILLLLLAVMLFPGCGVNVFTISDLRPADYEYPNNTARAEQLLMKMKVAHKSHLWDSIGTYQVVFEEESFGFFGEKSSPFKELAMQFNLNYIPGSFTGRMGITSGEEEGVTWGVQDGVTYRVENDKIKIEENDSYEFAMNTFQYFIEFPNRITDGTVIDYVGAKVIDGQTTEGVIVSWNSVEPQEDVDQYVIWLDQQTNRIVEVEYTVREKFKFSKGTAEFSNYKEFNEFLLPATISSRSNIKEDGYLHVKKIMDFTPDVLTVNDLTPLE